MNKNILNDLTTGLLDGGYLDLEFLIDTIEEHKLKVDDILDNHEDLFWEINVVQINYLIYTTLTIAAQNFIDSNQDLFEEYSSEYFIHTNYLDSGIRFEDEEVQNKFEES